MGSWGTRKEHVSYVVHGLHDRLSVIGRVTSVEQRLAALQADSLAASAAPEVSGLPTKSDNR